jgi:hypothetical protein
MKFIITENKLEQFIIRHLDKMYDVNEINWVNPYEYDDETGEESENPNINDFYLGDYDGPYDSDFLFRWIGPEYYDVEDSDFGEYNVELQKESPILEVHESNGNELNNYFGNKWHEPFKIWFEEKFGLPIKTIKVGIS